jgi:hypothetical protein
MSQLQLNRVSKEIIDYAEKTMVPDRGLSKAVDDYFVQRLKEDEMQHADVDPRIYDGMRRVVQAEVLPLYEQFRRETERVRERRQKRKLWQYVLGTVGFIEVLQLVLTRGRSLAPQVLIPTVILNTFVGFILYAAAQYLDDLLLGRARRRLEHALEGLENRVETDLAYDHRRELMDNEVLRAEALEILTHYLEPESFWRDYYRAREADPTLPAEVRSLELPAFEKFLGLHAQGQTSTVARQHRFNRLFMEAHEVFLARDREGYVSKLLRALKITK